jgi:MFS family permease
MYATGKLGCRRDVLIGCVILIIGAIPQTASYSLAPMTVGRVVARIGNGLNTVAIIIWKTETAQPKDRKLIFQLVTNIFGIVITNLSTHQP